MAVELTYNDVTIRGITYSKGSSFRCASSQQGRGNSEGGDGTASTLSVGTTYYFYAKATGDSNNVTYPYAVSNTSGSVPRGWYKEAVFPYATYPVRYNANGGTGAPTLQRKTYNTPLTLRADIPTRTGYTFQGWGISKTDETVNYAAGATYSANASITLYAIWKAATYTISFNANGGSGAPSNVTKTYDKTLTLPTKIPTRTNYEFLGWSTDPDAATATYAAGGSYTANVADTLYAVWKVKYVLPSIENFKVIRCTSSGAADDFGTYAKVTFDWECNQLMGSNPAKSIKVLYAEVGTTTWTSNTISFTSGAKSGQVSKVIGSNAISIENRYQFKVTVVDTLKSGSTTSSVVVIPAAKFAIDFGFDGASVAIGGVATRNNTFEVNLKTLLTGGIEPVPIPANANLNNYLTTGFYRCSNLDAYGTINNVPDDDDAQKSFFLEVLDASGITQIFTTVLSDRTAKAYTRQYNASTWGDWRPQPLGNAPLLANKPSIPSNTDLNSITTPGTYACIDAVAKTLTNRLSDSGFTMDVSQAYVDDDYVTQQLYYPYHGIEYRRRYTKSTKAWTDWRSNYFHIGTGNSKVLASTSSYMNSNQTVSLNEAISEQPNGIVLVWSYYNSGAQDRDWSYHFIPKGHITESITSQTVQCLMVTSNWDTPASKTVIITDTSITGVEGNSSSATSDSGITYNNRRYVLRYVLGV